MPILTITNRKGITFTVLYDDQDAHLFESETFHVLSGKYVRTSKNKYLHRLIMGVTDRKIVVDHISGNTLDCRRQNLRLCSQSENCANRVKKTNATSKYLGVLFSKRSGRWLAVLRKDKKQRYLGTYQREVDAAKAYDRKAKELHGEFARLNFPT